MEDKKMPKEIERKFLIHKPTEQQLKLLDIVSDTDIEQTYLKRKNPLVERRVRLRGNIIDGYKFYYTEKSEEFFGVRDENEYIISPEEYLELLTEKDNQLVPIKKNRKCFNFENKLFELDIYPFSDKYAILEVELKSMDEDIKLPPLDIVKEVTGIPEFRNENLSRNMCFPDECWIYEVGEEIPEVLSSGSNFYNVVNTKDEKKAFELLKECNRNYIRRYRRLNRYRVYQWYDFDTHEWRE